MVIITETPRIILRQFEPDEAALILQLNNNAEVVRYVHEPVLTAIADAEKVLHNIILPQYTRYGLGRWALFSKNDGGFIGWCGLKCRPELDNEIDLGYRLLPAFWGKGLATEAARAALEVGFRQKALDEITGRAHVDNTASLTILEKIGLQYVKHETVDECPVKTYRLTRAQYLAKTDHDGI